jgi:PPIC-type PPIASE domain
LKAFLCGLVCLLAASMAAAQANSQPQLKTRANQVEELQPGDASSSVAPDAPVITINGVCDKGTASGADCKTVITREQFEKIIKSVQPNMPKAAQRQFANRYVNILLLSQKAHELGLDKGPEFDQQMYLQRLQVTARLAAEQLQKEGAKVSDQEITDYYSAHTGDFRTISYERIYVPKQKSTDASAQKANDSDAQKKREASEADMKAEADKLRVRAAAGEDFVKLQQEAYDFANMKLKANNAPVQKVRKSSLSPADQAIFDLKKGDVSQVLADPQGYMIYKVQDFQEVPLADVREEVSRTLAGEKTKSAMELFQKTAATGTTYDSTYFATPTAPSLRNPGESAPPASTPPASQTPGKK